MATNTSKTPPQLPAVEVAEARALAVQAGARRRQPASGRLQAYGGDAFPFFVLLDAKGKVVARQTGEISDSTITTSLKDLAAGKPISTLG